MKLIFFSFRHRHREKELNNFLKTRRYGDFFLINFGWPLRYVLGKLLLFLNIGRAISCDGRPNIKDISKGINFWMRGTYFDIPKNLRNYNNNYITIPNPILKNKNVLKIYPIINNAFNIKENLKLIFISKTTTNKNILNLNFWLKFKEELLENFSLIDDINFWNKHFSDKGEKDRFNIYCDLKVCLRNEIIHKIKNIYGDSFRLIGNDWKHHFKDAENSNYNINYIKNIYRGNICIDLGSTLGSISLYSRSNQIIESGGIIIQSKHLDTLEVWNDLSEKIIFNNENSMIKIINNLFNDRSHGQNLLDKINLNFANSKQLIEKSLQKIFP